MLASLLVLAAAAGPPRVVSTGAPIRIDGALDEAAWSEAEPVTDFLRFQPVEGGAPPGRTEVRFLQDEKNLYVGIRVADADYPIRARISRREDINADDQIGVYLDTFRDERTGYIFYFNGLGIQQDIRVGPGFGSFSWNTVLRTRGRLTEDGFELEVAIPWRSLKYPKPEGEQTWGLILTRKIPAEGAKYSFPVTERGHPRLFTQAAQLTGLHPSRRGSGLEIMPSLTLIQQARRESDDAPLTWVDLDPAHEEAVDNWLAVVRPSLDVRLGVTPNLGLATTINPDFSQVDQDPTFIDLNQRFAFVLPENRPFFLDGTEYFDDQNSMLYSRSIVDPLYGFKLSGREGAFSVGALHALDRNPSPSVHERDTPGFRPEDVEGAVAVNEVARVRVDAFGDGFVGAVFADKRIVGPGRELRGSHTAAGLDARIPLDDRWTLDARGFQSLTGSGDGPLTWGQEVALGVNRAGGIGGAMWSYLADATPGLRKETGFLNQSGITRAGLGGGWTFEPDGPVDTVFPWVDVGGQVERSGEQMAWFGTGADIVHHGIHTWDLKGGVQRIVEGTGEDELGKVVGAETVWGPWGELGYTAELGRVLAIDPEISAQRTMDFENLGPATQATAKITVTLRPTAGLRLDTTVRGDVFDPSIGERARASLVRHWTTWQFTQKLGLRSMVEYSAGNVRDDRLVTTLLVTWLDSPGTAIHAGWVERTSLETEPRTLDRSVFLKASVLLRP